MLARIFFFSGLIVTFAGSASAQIGIPGPRYDGNIKVLDLDGPDCPTFQKSQTFSAVYRGKPGPNSQREEAMSIAIPTGSGALYLGAVGGNGTFAGKDQEATGTVIIDGFRGSISNVTVNLNFNPNNINGVDEFTFKGTIQKYFSANCTATIRGHFFARQ